MPAVRDLLGIVRAMYRAEVASQHPSSTKLARLQRIGASLTAIELASASTLGTVGHRGAWQHAEEALEGIGREITILETLEPVLVAARRAISGARAAGGEGEEEAGAVTGGLGYRRGRSMDWGTRSTPGIEELRARIAACKLPRQRSDLLMIATWNFRDFGKHPRQPSSLMYIAEIHPQLDLVWIVEPCGDQLVLGHLGPQGHAPVTAPPWRILPATRSARAQREEGPALAMSNAQEPRTNPQRASAPARANICWGGARGEAELGCSPTRSRGSQRTRAVERALSLLRDFDISGELG